MNPRRTSFSLSITKDQTLALKAIAILLIVIHNFSRWVNPITGESEFYFNQSALSTAIDVAGTNVWMFFKAFFNYFGHYGVQLFIFLSGYGLVQSYLHEQPSWLKYVYHRFQKLYPSLVVAILLYLIYQVFVMRQFPVVGCIAQLFGTFDFNCDASAWQRSITGWPLVVLFNYFSVVSDISIALKSLVALWYPMAFIYWIFSMDINTSLC